MIEYCCLVILFCRPKIAAQKMPEIPCRKMAEMKLTQRKYM